MKEQKYYEEIKTNLIKNEVYKKVKDYSKNRSDLETYYNVGKLLSEAGKHYGEGIIKQYSIKLTEELGRNYNERTLRRFRQYYNFVAETKWSTLSTKLTWSHLNELFALDNTKEIEYYIYKCENQNLSVRQLRELIKSKEYERLPESTKNKLIKYEDLCIKDLVPNPIIIENKNNVEIANENALHNLILENIESFMEQLGDGFTYKKSEYPIKLGDKYNYIDLLLFNIDFNCYIVIELKVTELKKEHIGQIEVYMNYIDQSLKKLYHDKTIGIIICKRNNKYIIGFASDERILLREYLII